RSGCRVSPLAGEAPALQPDQMRKEILAIVASAIALVTFVARAQVGAIDPNRPLIEHEIKQEHEQGNPQKYTCAMHPKVITDHPGNCPKCGMTLVPLKEKKCRTSNPPSRSYGVAGAQRPTPNHRSHMSHPSAVASAKEDPSHEMHQHEMEMHSSVD